MQLTRSHYVVSYLFDNRLIAAQQHHAKDGRMIEH